MDGPLQRIRDITPGSSWPPHLTDIIRGESGSATNVAENVPGVLMKLDEITACICHVAMIEIGFVPAHIQIDPTEVRFMTEKERIVSLSSQLPPQHRNSSTGIVTASYRAICENPKNLITHTFRRDVENQESTSTINQSELSPEETEPLYIYTSPVDVIMMAQNGTLSLHGHVRLEDSADTRSQVNNVHLDVNIRDYLPTNCSVKNYDVNALLLCQQWLDQIQLDGPRLSDTLKIQFGKILLTLVDGISFEPGLQHMSPELLVNVFRFLPIEDVCHVTQASHYMYAVSDSDIFWLKRIELDFPAQAPAIRAHFQVSNSPRGADKEDSSAVPNATPSPSTVTNTTAEESVYREYIRLYQSRRPPRRRLLHPIYRRLLVPRRSFTPLLGFHPPLLRRFW